MSRRAVLALFLLLGAALWPVRAHADAAGDERKARAHAKTAKAYFDAGDYPHAIVEYEAAYALDHKPSRLYNLAVCHERSGDRRGALGLYRQYLEADPDGEAARPAAESIALLDREIAAEDANAKQQEQEQAKEQAKQRERQAQAEADAKKAQAEADAKKAQADRVAPRLTPPATTAPPAPPARDDASRWAPPPRWLWPTIAGTAILTGLVLDLAPSSAHNGKLDGTDYVPLGFYAVGITFAAVWVF